MRSTTFPVLVVAMVVVVVLLLLDVNDFLHVYMQRDGSCTS